MPSTLRHVSPSPGPTPGRSDAALDAAGTPAGVTPGVVAGATPGLAALRAELDRLDDAMHDLLMRRAEVVGQVAALGVKGGVPLRPGREASIVRRLLARHAGSLPGAGIVRIWRELICACTSLQRPLLIAVCETGGDPAHLAAAREHFGALVPVRARRTAAEALRDAESGAATAAVLPVPADGEAPDVAWWTGLLHGAGQGRAGGDAPGPRLHVVARLPFWAAPRPEGAPAVEALVVSTVPPDPSGADRSLLGVQAPAGCDRERLTRALAAAGFAAGAVIVHRDVRPDSGASETWALADVEGFVAEGDPRLAVLAGALGTPRPPVVLGAYAVPLSALGSGLGSAPARRTDGAAGGGA